MPQGSGGSRRGAPIRREFKHTSALAFGLYVPGAHGVATAEPTEHDVPAGQITHWLMLDITVRLAFLCVPPGHGSAAAAPVVQ